MLRNCYKLILPVIFFLSISTPVTAYGWPFFFSTQEQAKPIDTPVVTHKLVLDPAGDAHTTGREIGDVFERSLTLQCCQALKEQIETSLPSCRVFLTRMAGETIEPLQTISFSNQVGATLHVSLHFFEHTKQKPELFIYTFSYDPATDFIEKKSTDLALIPYDQAYKLSLKKTREFSTLFFNACMSSPDKHLAHCHEPIAVPFKPLRGISAPAFGIEIGISRKDQVPLLIPLILYALKLVIQS